MIEELRCECLVKQVLVVECKACEKSYCSYSISNETDSKQAFGVHTHSDKYSDYLVHLINYTKLEEQAQCPSASIVSTHSKAFLSFLFSNNFQNLKIENTV